MNLDGLKLLPSKALQHGLIREGEVSEAREARLVSGDNGVYLSMAWIRGSWSR